MIGIAGFQCPSTTANRRTLNHRVSLKRNRWGETHKLLLTRLAGKREVHMRMFGESFAAVYAVAHIATQYVGIVVAKRKRW
jgi:hypothetical protein